MGLFRGLGVQTAHKMDGSDIGARSLPPANGFCGPIVYTGNSRMIIRSSPSSSRNGPVTNPRLGILRSKVPKSDRDWDFGTELLPVAQVQVQDECRSAAVLPFGPPIFWLHANSESRSDSAEPESSLMTELVGFI